MTESDRERGNFPFLRERVLLCGGLTCLSGVGIASSIFLTRSGPSRIRRAFLALSIGAGCGITGQWTWSKFLAEPLKKDLDCVACAVGRGVLIYIGSGVILPVGLALLASRVSRNLPVNRLVDALNFEGKVSSSVMLYGLAGCLAIVGYSTALEEFKKAHMDRIIRNMQEKEADGDDVPPAKD